MADAYFAKATGEMRALEVPERLSELGEELREALVSLGRRARARARRTRTRTTSTSSSSGSGTSTSNGKPRQWWVRARSLACVRPLP
jgi:hypothetical protein